MKKYIKQFFNKHPYAMVVLCFIFNYFPFRNSLRIGFKNKLRSKGIFKKTQIRIYGCENKIIVKDFSRLVNTKIMIYGNNNTIIIGEKCFISEGEFHVEDSNSTIEIGDRTSVCGRAHLACIEGCEIKIGEDCLFSSEVTIRTGDSHSIIDCNTRKRINPSKSVFIGKHVWVGHKATIQKGVSIANRSIIGACSVVTKVFTQENVAIAGNPAKVIKTNIDWDGKRI